MWISTGLVKIKLRQKVAYTEYFLLVEKMTNFKLFFQYLYLKVSLIIKLWKFFSE